MLELTPLLVIGCPGALVISIPVSIVAGIGRVAKDNILIKGAEFLETSAKITAVAVDKTGTLAMGSPQVTEVIVLDPTMIREQVLTLAGRVEAGFEHRLARAILDAALNEGLPITGLPESTEPVPGKGIAVTTAGRRILIGNMALLAQYETADTAAASRVADELAQAGRTPMIIAVHDTATGVIDDVSGSVVTILRTRLASFPARPADPCPLRNARGPVCHHVDRTEDSRKSVAAMPVLGDSTARKT